MRDPIVFYDIPGDVPGTAWSPHTWRIRYALNHKRLPYKTVWVEYPDIARTCQAIGARPTAAWPDGTPMYTLPALADPATGAALADSLAIARYLDAAYPDTPRAVPAGTDALHEALQAALNAVTSPHIQMLVMPAGLGRLHEASRAYYKPARERQWGGRMEEWAPPGSEVRVRHWEALRSGFGQIAGWMAAGGEERRFFVGEEPCLADFMIAARLVWVKKALGEERDEWKDVETWNGGRWARLLDDLYEFSTVL